MREVQRLDPRPAWFQDGPADGAAVAGRTRVDGGLPEVATLTAAGAYVGAADEPEPAVGYIYVRVDDPDDEAVYRYHGR